MKTEAEIREQIAEHTKLAQQHSVKIQKILQDDIGSDPNDDVAQRQLAMFIELEQFQLGAATTLQWVISGT